MSIQVIKRDQQANGAFNGRQILEKKPIGFPQDGGDQRPYSNLFYWAHAWNDEDSQIGLHPHQGFEIMSFVLEGKIDHYDTKNKQWLPLETGDVQIIRSGSGISHSEIFRGGCSMFQIWFDPDLSKTLAVPASYDDYRAKDFPVTEENGLTTIIYKGKNAPIQMESEGIAIREFRFDQFDGELKINADAINSFYLIDGKVELANESLDQEDFAIVKDTEKVSIKSEEPGRLFLIESPAELTYKTYAERFVH